MLEVQARFVGAELSHEFAIAFQLRERDFRRRASIDRAPVNRGFSNERVD